MKEIKLDESCPAFASNIPDMLIKLTNDGKLPWENKFVDYYNEFNTGFFMEINDVGGFHISKR